MRMRMMTSFLVLAFAAAPMLVGCDKKISEDTTTHTNADGSVSKDSTVVTQKPDGTIVKQQDVSKAP